jgi:hypothetical protein
MIIKFPPLLPRRTILRRNISTPIFSFRILFNIFLCIKILENQLWEMILFQPRNSHVLDIIYALIRHISVVYRLELYVLRVYEVSWALSGGLSAVYRPEFFEQRRIFAYFGVLETATVLLVEGILFLILDWFWGGFWGGFWVLLYMIFFIFVAWEIIFPVSESWGLYISVLDFLRFYDLIWYFIILDFIKNVIKLCFVAKFIMVRRIYWICFWLLSLRILFI